MHPSIQRDCSLAGAEKLIDEFVANIRATKRIKLRKFFSSLSKSLKRELRRGVEDPEDRLERERAAKDAIISLEELKRPEVGLGSDEELRRYPSLFSCVSQVRDLVKRIENGEVDRSKRETKTVRCPVCKGSLGPFPYRARGHYCDGCSSPRCKYRCTNDGCNFDLCGECYKNLSF